jgi:hypothetical protein
MVVGMVSQTSLTGMATLLELTVVEFPPIPLVRPNSITIGKRIRVRNNARKLSVPLGELLHEYHPHLLTFVGDEVGVEAVRRSVR